MAHTNTRSLGATWTAARLEWVLKMTQAMLKAAHGGEWEQLSVLEWDRQQKMSAVTPGAVGPSEAAGLAAVMQRVLSLNQEIADLVETERRRCGEELGQFKRARQATLAYQQTIP